ncbi:MAG: response regulator [Hyphomicrobiaceae bacterium]|nr:response regulator [Hyphomicrobiaceae bacterium]
MKHCMVVDDSDVIRKVARAYLERLGYMVTEAESGLEALERCGVGMPDLILMDWHMPGQSSIETIAALRRISHDRQPYVIYMTTENDDEDIGRAMAVGADNCLLKPFDKIAFEGKITEIALHG